ncbi:MAG: hypothetical protein ACE5I1_31535, partial [bacterium]
MKTLSTFIFSLFSLPFLIPWFVSEKLFQFFLQPVVIRKYQVGQIKERNKKKFRLRPRTVLLTLVLGYSATIVYRFIDSQASILTALKNFKLFFIIIYNDAVSLVNAVLAPLNDVLLYAQGGQIGFLQVMLSFYMMLLPLIVITNIVFCLMTTRVMLQRAVHIRNEADREVHIVGYSEKAKTDEIFFGLEEKRNGAPFYAKVSWLQGHTQVIGSPGSGKTESIIQPLWFQSVRRNVPTIVLDGKASSRNVDRFYTIATSLAQGHEIIYFNPAEPGRSASYNPLLHGSVEAVKNRILSAINWAKQPAANREKLDFYLGLVLQAIRKIRRPITLSEILRYFDSKMHVHNQLPAISDPVLQENLNDLLNNYSQFQKETAFFTLLLLQICNAEYAHLLSEREPELDLQDAYSGKKDSYFTLPISPNDPAMAFLGQLIIGDIQATYHHFSMEGGDNNNSQGAGSGLLIVDELAKFASPQFIELLKTSRNLGVSVCYTDQTLAELEN